MFLLWALWDQVMMDSQQVKLIQPLLSSQEGLSLLQDPPSTVHAVELES